MGNYPFGSAVKAGLSVLEPSGDTTGATDFTLLQNALNTAPPGGQLVLAASTTPFWINAPLIYRNGVSISGLGQSRSSLAAIIRQAAGANMVAPGLPALTGRGVWVSGTAYVANNAVLLPIMPTGAFYTSANPRGNFAASTVYSVNDVVFNPSSGGGNNLTYICIAGYTSTATTPDQDTTHWQQVATSLYYCILATSGTSTPDTDATHWTLVQPVGLLSAYEWANNVSGGGQPVRFENLQLDGNVTANPYTSACGVLMQNFWSNVNYNYILNMGYHGIVLTDTALGGNNSAATGSEVHIVENQITQINQHGFLGINATTNANLDGFFLDNILGNCFLNGALFARSAGWSIRGNHLYGTGGTGIDGGFSFATKIIDNYIEVFGQQNAPSYFYNGIGTNQLNGRTSHFSRNFVGSNDPAVNTSHYNLLGITAGNGQTAAYAVITDNAMVGPASTSNSIGLVLQNGSGGAVLTAVATGNQVRSTATESFIQTGVVVAAKNYGSETFVGQVDVSTAGAGLQVAEGSNAKQGTLTLNGTTAVVVSNTSVTANSRIFLTINLGSGTVGSPYVSARTAGTSFSVKSTTVGDVSTVAYEIIEPG